MLPATGFQSIQAQEKGDDVMALGQSKLIEILNNPDSSGFARAKACQRLAVIGTKDAVQALGKMLLDPQFAHYARFGLEPIEDPSVDDTLRQALGKTTGKLRVGIIRSIGFRKDAGAVAVLSNLMDASDTEAAAAAAEALGRIGGVAAAKELKRVLERTKKVAGACLECAEGLLSRGDKEPARAMFDALLLRPDLPAFLREAAAHGRKASERP